MPYPPNPTPAHPLSRGPQVIDAAVGIRSLTHLSLRGCYSSGRGSDGGGCGPLRAEARAIAHMLPGLEHLELLGSLVAIQVRGSCRRASCLWVWGLWCRLGERQ